ncbi:MAG: hypothetical protein QY318_03995 [Candidatus Dojkabacteria bacterium]|nr:MAG: hypothetical protein QY318_03995 [Candidatus Dojkabacteria bacterium]
MLELFTMTRENLSIKTFRIDSLILILFASAVNLLAFPAPTQASGSATFSITPSNGYVVEGQQFSIDVLIDTAGTEVVQARAVITFDPTRVRLTNAGRNNSLFAQYPTDGQTTDNTNGVVMVTGFSQAGVDDLYATDGAPDVFVRLTFEALREGSVTFDWEYNGSDQPFKSVIMSHGSPPQNILNSKPAAVTFTIQDSGVVPEEPEVPDTAVRDYLPLYIGGLTLVGAMLIFFGGSMVVKASENVSSTKKRTVVDYD